MSKLDFWRSDWFLGVLVALVVLALWDRDLVQSLERKAYDLGVQATSRTPSDKIAIIAIEILIDAKDLPERVDDVGRNHLSHERGCRNDERGQRPSRGEVRERGESELRAPAIGVHVGVRAVLLDGEEEDAPRRARSAKHVLEIGRGARRRLAVGDDVENARTARDELSRHERGCRTCAARHVHDAVS